jgi:NTP pyrophosphatase (non-canonical NTP hydrolase)
MELTEYLQVTESTETKFPEGLTLTQFEAELLHHTMGVVTESGELMDALKKNYIYKKPLDIINVTEEAGDLMWYIAGICRLTGISFETLCEININKLRKRYPNLQYSNEKALNRNLTEERKALEVSTMPHIVQEMSIAGETDLDKIKIYLFNTAIPGINVTENYLKQSLDFIEGLKK